MRYVSMMFATILLVLPATLASAAQDPSASLEALAVELATTPAQHAIVADYYRAKAADARAEADRHRAMKQAYSGGKLRDKMAMEEHCDKLIADYTALAAEYDALAKEHAAEAGK